MTKLCPTPAHSGSFQHTPAHDAVGNLLFQPQVLAASGWLGLRSPNISARDICWRVMRPFYARWVCMTLLVTLVGVPRIGHAVDCSERFPVGSFALTRAEAAVVAATLPGYSPSYVLKKAVEMKSPGTGDPCEFVYGFDVFELTDKAQPGALVAGCRGDFDGDGVRNYVVLLLRRTDGVKLAYAFLARDGTFEVIELGLYGEPPAWSGPYCSPKPQSGIFEGPDFEGTGERVRVRVVGDLITMGWSTYYWRPDLSGSTRYNRGDDTVEPTDYVAEHALHATRSGPP